MKNKLNVICVSFLLAGILAIPVHATNVKELETEVEELDTEKSQLEGEVEVLDNKLLIFHSNLEKLVHAKEEFDIDLDDIRDKVRDYYSASVGLFTRKEAVDIIQGAINFKSGQGILLGGYRTNESIEATESLIGEYKEDYGLIRTKQQVLIAETECVEESILKTETEIESLRSEITEKDSKITTANNKIKAATSSSNSSSSTNSSTSSSTGSSTTGTGTGQDIVNYALKYVGTPYKYGGNSISSGIDCSGLVYVAYAKYGYSVPRSSSALAKAGQSVSYSSAKAGDIICYNGHVGIYIGNDQMVHASTEGDSGIKISHTSWGYVLDVRRIID